MTLRLSLAASVLALTGVALSAHSAESIGDSASAAAKKTGHAVAQTGRDVGHATAEAGRKTGHAVAETGRDVGHATAEAGRDAGHAVHKETDKAKSAAKPASAS